MDEQTLRLLEFDKILARLAHETGSPLGRAEAEKLRPHTDRGWIAAALRLTTEARRIWEEADPPSLAGLHDISGEVARAGRGATLGPEELLRVASTLGAGRRLRGFFLARRERYPGLAAIAERCAVFPALEAELARCLGPEGEVRDEASPELRRLRSLKRTLQNRVQERLEAILHAGGSQRYLQEALVTIRNGRYVIPVKQEFQSMVPGLVHDRSSSGATVFIEPMAVVELNNELRALSAAEEEEIRRILAALSGMVGEVASEMATTLAALGELDLALAKGRLSRRLDATEPELNEEGWLEFRRARHPLLGQTAVPIDVRLGRDFHTLVITGPNTGGKTVALKTIGLLTLMAQAGLHIPAAAGSTVGIFTEVACDIGDEQSIEQNLSTFSSHLTRIVGILERASGPRSLVLLDELGAGTDPGEGAALAMAILEYLHGLGVRTVAPTHYGDLKLFAYRTPGMSNAAVEFDALSLRPTYRLLLGLPGQSNALAIAGRLGLSPEIIARAEGFLHRGQKDFESLLGSIAEDARAAREARRAAEEAHAAWERARREYEAELTRLKEERASILRNAREEAREILRRTRREAEELFRQLEEAEEEKRRRMALEALREETRAQLLALSEPPPSGETTGPPLRDLKSGETVFVRSLGRHGLVVGQVGPDQALVQLGVMKITLPLTDLARAAAKEEKEEKSSGGNSGELGRTKATVVSPELDLRGMKVEEALLALDKYLDDLCLAGLGRARLIHGKGTGALRTAIGEYLRRDRRIKSARLGEPGEGGAGVTVVELV
ncbi:MAG: endonuclease MutS2 [Firmicutes bacterium]|nr:endonuclease MutS2 [Bacillota bacterium]